MPDSNEDDAQPAWVRGDLPAGEQASGAPDDSQAQVVDVTAGTEAEASIDEAADGAAESPDDRTPEDGTAASIAPTADENEAIEAVAPNATSLGEAPANAEHTEQTSAEAGAEEATGWRRRGQRGWGPATKTMEPVDSAALNGGLSLEACVESLLFVAEGPVAVNSLAEALEVGSREVEAALGALAESYQSRGLSVQRFRDKVQLTTAPAAAARVERFLGLAATTPLSRAALETLAIIAYQQPVTRPQIEAIRGVNSDSVIKNLLAKGLIEEAGRAEGPGRPVLYATTTEFMQHFGLGTLSDLPPLTLPEPENGSSPEAVLKG
jgi:segregation and condensation protein B